MQRQRWRLLRGSWLKTVGGLGKLLVRGLEKVRGEVTFAATCFNLVILKNLEAEPALS